MRFQRLLFVFLAVAAMFAATSTAQAGNGIWQPVDPNGSPFLWSTSGDWVDGNVADGVGALAEINLGGNIWYNLDIDSDRTLGSWISVSGGNPNPLTTSGGATLTWDTGDSSDAVFRPFTNSGYNVSDDRDMVLQSDLDWGNDAGTQREHNIRGVISGTGKLKINFYTNNYDNRNHGRLNIGNSGDAPNTYEGGTDIGIYNQGNWGAWTWNDKRIANLRKDGALGTGDVAMTHIHGNLQIENDGPDGEADGDNRIDDSAALKLISGYDPDISQGGRGYFHTNVILDTDVNETVDELYMNGFRAPAGTYDATTNPIWFRGDGVMTVTNGTPAASYASTGDGNWNTPGTWGAAAPSYFDESSVGHAVVVAADAGANNVAVTAGSLTVNAGQKLLVQDTFDPSGGTVTVDGTLETVNLASTTGLTLGAGSTLTVGQTMVVDSNFDATPAATLQLPGGFAGDTIAITSSGALNLGTVDLNRTSNLQVSGVLNINGNVTMEYGGRLSGSGTILQPDADGDPATNPSKKVEIARGGHWQLITVEGPVTLAPGDSVGTLTVEGGEFEFRNSNRDNFPNIYEWEVGQPGSTDAVSIVDGLLDLRFSFDNDPALNRFKIQIRDGGGYVASATDKLDLFTYDALSGVEVNESAGLVQGVDSTTFDTSLLDGTWTVGTLELRHEQYGDGSGHIYLTGLSGGTPISPALAWDGGVGNWADAMWGGAAPTANEDMVINASSDDSVVTVAADFITGGTGPAASVFAGEEYAGKLVVASGNTLEVTGETTAGEFGKIAIENGATLQTGTAVIEIDGRLIAGVQGSDRGLLDSAGQLTIEDADAIQVDWMPGTDAGSMFGGTYTIAQYSGTALATTGTTANEDANIGAAYIKSIDYAADLGGGVLGVNVELHAQGLGDTDLDGDVDGDDLATFGLAWAPSGTDKTWFDGDFDFDGDIDGDDLAALGLAWAPSGIDFPAGDLQVTAVPEPGTIVMLLIGMAGLLIYRKRR